MTSIFRMLSVTVGLGALISQAALAACPVRMQNHESDKVRVVCQQAIGDLSVVDIVINTKSVRSGQDDLCISALNIPVSIAKLSNVVAADLAGRSQIGLNYAPTPEASFHSNIQSFSHSPMADWQIFSTPTWQDQVFLRQSTMTFTIVAEDKPALCDEIEAHLKNEKVTAMTFVSTSLSDINAHGLSVFHPTKYFRQQGPELDQHKIITTEETIGKTDD